MENIQDVDLDLLKQAFLMGFMISCEGYNGEMSGNATEEEVKACGGDWFAAVRANMEAAPGYLGRLTEAMEQLAPAFNALLEARELRGVVQNASLAAGGVSEGTAHEPAQPPARAPRSL